MGKVEVDVWIKSKGRRLRCTRDTVLISETFSPGDYEDPECGVAGLIRDLQPPDWTPTHIREDYGWDAPSSYHLEGWRMPTPEEQTAIDAAWVKEDEKQRKARAKAKERNVKAKVEKEARERQEYERLQEKYG